METMRAGDRVQVVRGSRNIGRVGTVQSTEVRDVEDSWYRRVVIELDPLTTDTEPMTMATTAVNVKMYHKILHTDPRYIHAKSNLQEIYRNLRCDTSPSETHTATMSG